MSTYRYLNTRGRREYTIRTLPKGTLQPVKTYNGPDAIYILSRSGIVYCSRPMSRHALKIAKPFFPGRLHYQRVADALCALGVMSKKHRDEFEAECVRFEEKQQNDDNIAKFVTVATVLDIKLTKAQMTKLRKLR